MYPFDHQLFPNILSQLIYQYISKQQLGTAIIVKTILLSWEL